MTREEAIYEARQAIKTLDKALKTLQAECNMHNIGVWYFDGKAGDMYECSSCHNFVIRYKEYCPYCGSYNGGRLEEKEGDAE